MFAAYSRNTEAGARRIAAQRVQALPPPVVAPEPQSAPVGLAVACNVIPFRYPNGSARRIVEMVARMHGVGYADIMSKARTDRISHARQAAVCAVKEAFPVWSLNQIGRLFGIDHTSVLHAYQKRGYR